MTTNKEALQKIFEAALKEPEPQYTPTARLNSRVPTESYPKARSYGEPAPAARRVIEPVSNDTITPDAPKKKTEPVETAKTVNIPTIAAGSHDAASAELAGILDKKMAKDNSKRKAQFLMILIVLAGGIGGGIAWFIQSPDRVTELKSAVTEVQSATDVESITGEYDKSLEKVAVRGNQLDEATSALGASTELKAGEDGYMDKEMKGMMGGEGKTAGERAHGMEKSFGDQKK